MSSTNLQQRPSEVVRWDPFEDLEQLQQQLAPVFPNWLRMPAWGGSGNGQEGAFAPRADIEETDDAYMIEVELAGVKKEDVTVELSGRRLSVSGERKERERQGVVRRRTRAVGRFRYEFTLPGEVNEDKIEANLKDGVLTVRLPKATGEQSKQITVK